MYILCLYLILYQRQTLYSKVVYKFVLPIGRTRAAVRVRWISCVQLLDTRS
jgi:hypothetical protein